ncbi:MAG: hypothetical protein HGA65_10610 [Oscillochloris sp.]|nr:hypothetical protein [Oscillochloris sp.]
MRSGVLAARNGHRSAARDLFLALSRTYPGEVRAWLGLAGAAASVEEQCEALKRVIALEPDHPLARQTLAQLVGSPPAEPAPLPEPIVVPLALAPVLTPTHTVSVELEPHAPPDLPAPPRQRFPLMNRIALGTIGLLTLAILALLGANATGFRQRSATPAPLPSPIFQTVVVAVPSRTPAPLSPVVAVASPIRPVATAPAGLSPAPALPAATSSAQTGLPLGTLIEVDGWSITLLRPDHALILDGSIGDLRPSGHFVLALMAISNNSADPRLIPADLLTLVDSDGRQYRPTPKASTAYLALYKRGEHGDLALEDRLTAHSGMRSVPILFDVPSDADGLMLIIANSGSAGWAIDDTAAPPVNVGP